MMSACDLKKNHISMQIYFQLISGAYNSIRLYILDAYLLTVDGIVNNEKSLNFKVCYISFKTPILFPGIWFVVFNLFFVLQ